ncbi:MAG: hypothetical protein V7736_00525 [Colwellia polaris]|jgi:hypothetical protein
MILKEMGELGVERKKELDEYLDFSDFDKFIEILEKKFTGIYISKNSIEYLMATLLFSTNIKGAISSKYGLDGLSPAKVDSNTSADFEKIEKIISHLDQVSKLTKSLKSPSGNEFISYAQLGIGGKRLSSHLDELSKAFNKAMRLSKGETDKRKTYYLALKKASDLYLTSCAICQNTLTNVQKFEVFALEATYCVFLIKQKLLKKDFGKFKAEFWDVKRGLEKELKIIELEFISKLER